ncbi:hypothetical protein SGLAM104S_06801 [Streptomyces glaucescens]
MPDALDATPYDALLLLSSAARKGRTTWSRSWRT